MERCIHTLVPSKSRQVFMRPCVRRDLVTVIVGIFDPAGRFGVVNAVT